MPILPMQMTKDTSSSAWKTFQLQVFEAMMMMSL
jgi:hypothetical protein